MKISLIGPVYPYRGGIAHHTTLLAKHLRTRHDVQLISFLRQYPERLFPGHTDRDPSTAPLRVDASFALDPLNPLTWWNVAKQIQAWAPDVVILPWWVPFWAMPWLGLTILIRSRTKAKILFICHNVFPHEKDSQIIRFLTRLVLSRGDIIIVHATEELRKLESLVSRKLVVCTPLPTYAELGRESEADFKTRDPEKIRARIGLSLLHPNTHLLLFFGFVRPYKGLSVLLEAMPLIIAHIPVHLLVVGEIWGSSDKYRAQIARLGLAEHVTLVNQYVPNERLSDYFKAAEVVVLPYLTATQSAVVQLAFGYGVPVITSRVGGLSEVVQDGETGLLVRPGDPDALAQAVIRFFRENMQENMRTKILADQDRFDWRRFVEKIEWAVARSK